MKKLFTILGSLIFFLLYLIDGCKKDPLTESDRTASFTEEFESVHDLRTRGWINPTTLGDYWLQGIENSTDKFGVNIGFSAYSYRNTKDEYACTYDLYADGNMSTWLVTPVITLKNGDKISFYSRADTSTTAADRLQVRMSNGSGEVGTGNSDVGDFTSVILDINSSQSIGGYPTTWTKYEYTFTGLAGIQKIRLAFRYYVPTGLKAKMIGIDQFSFEAK